MHRILSWVLSVPMQVHLQTLGIYFSHFKFRFLFKEVTNLGKIIFMSCRQSVFYSCLVFFDLL